MLFRRANLATRKHACITSITAFLLHAGLLLSTLVFSPAAFAQSEKPTSEQQDTILDNFDNIDAWKAEASDDVDVSLHGDADEQGKSMRMDFDFHGVSGYATARRDLALDFPDNYELSFRVRGDAPINNLQFKLVDASGENVWWINRSDFVFGRDWQLIRIKKRQLDFAWGPTKDRVLRHSAKLELVVSSGHGGGHGSVYFDTLKFRALPVEGSLPLPVAQLSASSSRADSKPNAALDGDDTTAWRSGPKSGRQQFLQIDFQQPREFGGLVLHWLKDGYASDYDVQFSDDAEHWITQRSVHDSRGGAVPLYLPESETRYVRLALHHGPAKGYALAEIEIKDLAFAASPNAFLTSIARDAKRGMYPRGFSGEQSYWTLVGIDGGAQQGLLSEDGILETGKSSFSIEPFLLSDKKLLTWADVDIAQTLQEGYLPIPSVTWRTPNLALHITAFASGTRAQSQMFTRYRVENLSAEAREISLLLAVRPLQVNPPTQFLNGAGGVSPIHDLDWQAGTLSVNSQPKIVPLPIPDSFHATRFDDGEIVVRMAQQQWPQATTVHDDSGYASGAFVYRLKLAAFASTEIAIAVPLSGAMPPTPSSRSSLQWLNQQQAEVAAEWRGKLNRVGLHLPPAGQALADTLRTSLAHILISRDGAALQPGTRAYSRSWVRDGAMMNEALLRLGAENVARDFVEWYAAHQFSNGKVPCCVDWRGSDPVPENDSHGELIYAIAELYRYGHDRELLARLWPHVEAAATYMEGLRQSERTAKNRSAERVEFFGLMPASISHEGYSERPMHSYWDDFWALRGYKDAADMAAVLGKQTAADALARQRNEFRTDLFASIKHSGETHKIDYLAGCAELGDFDATSSTIAIAPGGEQARLPSEKVTATFERYWRDFVARRDSPNWDVYTPYELRTVGIFVRLGWTERAQELLNFFFSGRRPGAWNQWAEVVGRESRTPRFVGDMPHGWVASDFIRSALDMFAYEREADQSLVIGAGLPSAWLEGNGIAIENLRTPYGKLSYSLKHVLKKRILHIDTGIDAPGGLVFIASGKAALGKVSIDKKPAFWSGRELHIAHLPADIVIDD
ncbi:coagulation factor 5/8 type domain-containing protein [Pseudolysobacter antarcticus]|uniref:Coagulation factor 5/8 type domain-containing protein n=1 Tax=Pseudolysobacter antarcticus TaxID=2511995 RepID=A0A411HJQ9_9GAMM|nr:discoidin domain-containing protein [Pseudolysobacter antarcticus]QBB70776.1 coagulation factor 5/8 type domain-containing protein [Pseudolysobacter antarcticus]